MVSIFNVLNEEADINSIQLPEVDESLYESQESYFTIMIECEQANQEIIEASLQCDAREIYAARNESVIDESAKAEIMEKINEGVRDIIDKIINAIKAFGAKVKAFITKAINNIKIKLMDTNKSKILTMNKKISASGKTSFEISALNIISIDDADKIPGMELTIASSISSDIKADSNMSAEEAKKAKEKLAEQYSDKVLHKAIFGVDKENKAEAVEGFKNAFYTGGKPNTVKKSYSVSDINKIAGTLAGSSVAIKTLQDTMKIVDAQVKINVRDFQKLAKEFKKNSNPNLASLANAYASVINKANSLSSEAIGIAVSMFIRSYKVYYAVLKSAFSASSTTKANESAEEDAQMEYDVTLEEAEFDVDMLLA